MNVVFAGHDLAGGEDGQARGKPAAGDALGRAHIDGGGVGNLATTVAGPDDDGAAEIPNPVIVPRLHFRQIFAAFGEGGDEDGSGFGAADLNEFSQVLDQVRELIAVHNLAIAFLRDRGNVNGEDVKWGRSQFFQIFHS